MTCTICNGTEAAGCKVTHDLIYREICLVGNEVVSNLSMSGDEYVGGDLLLYEKNSVPQQKSSTKDKYFTLLPLTLLTGEPLGVF